MTSAPADARSGDRPLDDELRAFPRAALIAALLAGALVLRPQLTAIGPLLPAIQTDLGINHARAGLLATIPILCMGVFALPAARVIRRTDVRTAIAGCLALIAASTVLRAAAPGYAAVLALTLPFGIAAGLMGALLPVVVKQRFAGSPVLGTGIFALGLNVGASLGAGLAIPLAHATGNWRWSLGSLAAAGALGLPAWIGLSRHALGGSVPVATLERLPWRSTAAWAATLLFAFQAVCFFALNAWLADAMIERGWPEGKAGALVALLNLTPVPAVVLFSFLGGRHVGIDKYLGIAAAGLLASTVALADGWSGIWVWIVVIGLALGSLFSLSLVLSVLAGRGPGQVAAVAGMQLGVGYVVAALAPFALGVLRDATGSFSSGLWVIVGTAGLVAAAVVAVVLVGGARES